MVLVEALRRTLFPTRGIQKIIPKKQLFQSNLVRVNNKESHTNKGSQGHTTSGSLFLYWEVVALGTDPLNLKN